MRIEGPDWKAGLLAGSLMLMWAGCADAPPVESPGGQADTGGDGGAVSDDGGDGTTMSDTGEDGGDTAMKPPPTNLVYPTSGGGICKSDQFELKVSVGAPAGRGVTEGQNYRLRVAPVSP